MTTLLAHELTGELVFDRRALRRKSSWLGFAKTSMVYAAGIPAFLWNQSFGRLIGFGAMLIARQILRIQHDWLDFAN